MKIKFIKDGGFNKNGAFIEYDGDAPTGDEPEYERQSYLGFDLICCSTEIVTSFDVINEKEDREPADRITSSRVIGNGKIKPARWDSFSLSFLGSEKTYSEVSINIRSNTRGEAAILAGLNIKDDLDCEPADEFYVQIELFPDRFERLVSELRHSDAKLFIHIKTAEFRHFYATWSPSISEGRVIKFLDSERDVENQDDIPKDFWGSTEHSKMFSNPLDPLVSISVKRNTSVG